MKELKDFLNMIYVVLEVNKMKCGMCLSKNNKSNEVNVESVSISSNDYKKLCDNDMKYLNIDKIFNKNRILTKIMNCQNYIVKKWIDVVERQL